MAQAKKTKNSTSHKAAKRPIAKARQSLSPVKGALIFLAIFAVFGGGLLVFRSFALSWSQVQDTAKYTVSACRSQTTPRVGYKVLWAVRNKTSQPMNIVIYENMRGTQAGPLTIYPSDPIKTLPKYTEANAGTYYLDYFQGGTEYLTNFSLNPLNIAACSPGK
jgi:hypothetical protein